VVDILPARYFQQRGTQEFATAPVGTGPFKFKEWVKQDHLAVTANTEYWGTRPTVGEVVFKSVPEASTRVAGVQTGELDVSLLIPPEQAAPLQAAGLVVDSVNQGQGMVVSLRTTEGGPLADRRVRQAMNYAIDKEGILKNLLLGYGRVLDGQIVGPDALGYNETLKPYPYDPARAKALLAEAGFANGFEVRFHGSQGRYTKDREIEEAIVGQLAEVGINAKLEIMEAGVFISSFLGGTIGPAFIWAWQYLPAMDADLPLNFLSGTSAVKLYSSPQFDQLVARERATLNPDERQKALREMNALLHEDPPAIFLVQTPGIWAANKRVQGFRWRPDYLIDLTTVSVSN
jgi:peptide/nickel transport system substrate-binding protein